MKTWNKEFAEKLKKLSALVSDIEEDISKVERGVLSEHLEELCEKYEWSPKFFQKMFRGMPSSNKSFWTYFSLYMLTTACKEGHIQMTVFLDDLQEKHQDPNGERTALCLDVSKPKDLDGGCAFFDHIVDLEDTGLVTKENKKALSWFKKNYHISSWRIKIIEGF